MSKRAQYLQLLLESLIPLLGFFFWNWNLYFILLFYFLDLFAEEIMMYYRDKAVLRYRSLSFSRSLITLPLLSLSLLILAIFVIHLCMYSIHPEMDFRNEIVRFWNYRELGIPQGYLILPLVLLAAYQRYKIEFLINKGYESTDHLHLWKQHIGNHLFLLGTAGIILGLSQFIVLGEVFYVLLIVSGIAAIKLLRK